MVKVVCIEVMNILVKTRTFYDLPIPEKSQFLTTYGNGRGYSGTPDVDWNNGTNQILYYNHLKSFALCLEVHREPA